MQRLAEMGFLRIDYIEYSVKPCYKSGEYLWSLLLTYRIIGFSDNLPLKTFNNAP